MPSAPPPARRAIGHAAICARRDTGSVSLEIAILGPALLLLVFAVVQGGLWFYARSLALAAAEEGATAGAAYQADPSAAAARARAFLTEQAGDTLTSTEVTTTGSSITTVRIQVTGRSLSVLPGIPGLPVTQVAQADVERFTTDATP